MYRCMKDSLSHSCPHSQMLGLIGLLEAGYEGHLASFPFRKGLKFTLSEIYLNEKSFTTQDCVSLSNRPASRALSTNTLYKSPKYFLVA